MKTAAAVAMDPGVAQTVAATSAGMSVLAVLQEWALALLGVPLGVPLAGFAGACYGASFREPRTPLAFWRSVLVSAALASIVSPLVAHWAGLDARFGAPLAAVLSLMLEWGAPWFKANGPRIFDELWARITGGRKGGGS